MTLPEIALAPPREERSIENPAVPITSAEVLAYVGADGSGTTSGESVSPDSALSSSAVWAAVNLLAGTIGFLPLGLYKRLDPRGREPARDHPVDQLLRRKPNSEQTSQIFREHLSTAVFLEGNGYAYIEQDRNGKPIELWPLNPQTTRPARIEGQLLYFANEMPIRPDRIFHIPGLTRNGISGLSPVRKNSEAIGLAKAAEKFGAGFFGRGSQPSGVLEHPGTLKPETAAALRDSWEKMTAGNKNAHKTAVLEEGMQWKPTGVEPEKAQFRQTREYQTIEIARIFGVPPHMIASLDRATFSNIEHQASEFVTYALTRWLTRWEMEVDRKLLTKAESVDHYLRFSTKGLLRGDSAARSAYYRERFNIGTLSQNDIRELEDEPPIEGGDTYYVPLNMIPTEEAEDLNAQNGADSEEKPAENGPETPPEEQNSGDSGAKIDRIEAVLYRWIEESAARLVTIETDRIRRRTKKDPETLSEWLETFYRDHQTRLNEALGTPIRSYIEAISPELTDQAGEILAQAAHKYVSRSIGQLRGLIRETPAAERPEAIRERLRDWLTHRPAALAADITNRIAEETAGE